MILTTKQRNDIILYHRVTSMNRRNKYGINRGTKESQSKLQYES